MGKTNRYPLRGAAILAVMLFLPGCIPWPVSIAITGISYATTGKSISDHFLSEVVQKDCNVGRAIIDQSDICINDTDKQTIIVEDIDINQDMDIAPAAGANPNGG
ncbi:MAG: hypothetical protein HQ513_03755 [Rhodospirillales bacterium]|nr:hypothetical protein [Rhodospirillales bacterium]